MKGLIPLLLMVCLLFSGCSTWLDGNYSNVTPHKEHSTQPDTGNMTAASYSDLIVSLEQMILFCTESGVISVDRYDQTKLASDMNQAINYVQEASPIGAYAVDQITYDYGTSAGQSAVAVSISYVHTLSDIRKIKTVSNIDSAKTHIAEALDECAAELVLYINDFVAIDFAQWLDDYVALHPDTVMEKPSISINYYPETGIDQILEFKFIYQNSRDNLKSYQSRVKSIFEAAELYVSGDGSELQKYAQLYAFLMERYDYQIQTSLTPAYSLLIHGVGDVKAFATVYAAMCRNAGLNCVTLSGTRNAEAWVWNLIAIDGVYYHLDLLRCSQEGAFTPRTDEQMRNYVWDYSAYSTNPIEENVQAERP